MGENWRIYRQQEELVNNRIRREKEEHERNTTKEIKDAKDYGLKM